MPGFSSAALNIYRWKFLTYFSLHSFPLGFRYCIDSRLEMAALSMFLSHLFVLVLNCYLGASSGRTVKRGPRSAQDSDLLLFPLDDFSEGFDQGMVFQHMLKLHEKYNRENRLREGNTVRSFQASQGAWTHALSALINKR